MKKHDYRRGLAIYYRAPRSGDTVPGIALGYMTTTALNGRRPRAAKILMRGNWPTGDRTRWVTADRCETQEDCP